MMIVGIQSMNKRLLAASKEVARLHSLKNNKTRILVLLEVKQTQQETLLTTHLITEVRRICLENITGKAIWPGRLTSSLTETQIIPCSLADT